jgi:SHS2 domain-containing protein
LDKVIQAAAPSLPELFQAVGASLSAVITDPQTISPALREKVALEASSAQELLVEWTQLLLHCSEEQMIFSDFVVGKAQQEGEGRWSLTAELTGELIDPQRHTLTGPWKVQRAILTLSSAPITAVIQLVR